MFEHNGWPIVVALVIAGGLAGCNGKPEDTGQGASSDTPTLKTPAPPYPAWANAMLGHDLKQVSRGTAICKGVVDTVSAKHTGAHPGSEIEGWAWDEKDRRPVARVVFTDSSDRIVGGATEGGARPDVMTALPEVKTPAVGWKGVAGTLSGTVNAVGLTEDGAACVIGSTAL